MVKTKALRSRLLVFLLAFAVLFTYSVMPVNQAYAASKKPSRVTISKLTAVSSSSIKVTWKKANNAKKYQIYVSTKSKKGFKLAATVKSSKRSYTVRKYNKKALKANTKYYFKVRAVNGKKKGAFSKVKSRRTKKKSVSDRTVFVDANYVKSQAGKKNVVIAEVSWGPDAAEKLIPGSVHVDTDSLESNYQDVDYEFWDLRGFNNNYKELIVALESYGITTDTELICYGRGGTDSAPTRLAMAALTMGVKKVRVLDGGISAWTKAGNSTTDKAEIPTVKSFGRTSPLHPEWIISTADMLDKVKNDPNFKLVSIRSYDEYIGQNSGYAYIDIAGEPKGAVWGHDTDDGSYFINGKTVDTNKLNEYLKPYGASTKNELAFYCGTGWRATIPFLICYEEGIDNMKLWDDGWYVYSGAYADPWNYGDGSVKNGIDFNSYPVQIGDPAKGSVKETTVKGLWDADKYYNPMRGLSVKNESITTRFTGTIDNFDLMPPKGNIEKSVRFVSSDEAAVSVDQYGIVEVKDASAKKTVTITAESNATKGGKAGKTASFTLNIEPGTGIISASELKKAIEDGLFDSGYFRILDLRKAEDYAAGHIVTAISADVDGAVQGSDPDAAKANVEAAISGDKDTKYILICYSGNKYANTGKNILVNELGIDEKNVFILGQDDFTQGASGGMKAWNASYPEFAVSTFKSNAGIVSNGISPENLEKAIEGDVMPFVVMDVRAAEDYKKGHINGAELATCPGSGPDDASRSAVKSLVDEFGQNAIFVAACYSGQKCADTAYTLLTEAGVPESNIVRLIGGMAAWKGSVIPEE